MSFTLGADPEVFVGNNSGIKSIIGLIGGTKNNPLPLPIGDGFAVQEDNVALEYNIPASPSKQLFVDNIATAMSFIETTLRDREGLHFVKDSAISFPEQELQHPLAHVFGCDPDYNAWTGHINKSPRAKDRNLRSCGGHVHIGVRGTKYENVPLPEIIKACDVFLGIPSVLMDNGLLRKELYGKAGAFRPKDFGGEYRTLSNFWIFKGDTVGWVYDNVARALEAVYNGENFDNEGKQIQSCINNNNKELAQQFVEKYSLNVL